LINRLATPRIRRMTTSPLTGISSMATRALLGALAADCAAQGGPAVAFESVGGVDAAKRVAAGERFDVVVLASDAIARLAAGGHVDAASVTPLVRSGVAVAVRAGAPVPGLGDEAAVRAAVLAAPRIGYSTGPSGTALLQLFERWGVAETLRERLVQARPGIPVARLVADGECELGFQQLSELLNVPGITIAGDLPDAIQITTVFSAAVCRTATQPDTARALIAHLSSPDTADTKRRHGMETPR
jgi:molybdate transport system substrate-binding protein